jgi:hypothetical protein
METTPNPDEMSLTECGVHHATFIPWTQRNAERRICASFAIAARWRIAPQSPSARPGPSLAQPAHWTRVDRDYERICIDMQTLVNDLAIETPLAA